MEGPKSTDLARADALVELFPELVLLVEEVAERLRISTRTVTRAIEAGRLASLKDSLGCHRILRSAVIDWLAAERRRVAA